MNREPFRIALVGMGQIAEQAHLPAALASPLARVDALVDLSPTRPRELAREFGIEPRIFTDVGDLEGLVDGVVLATPNHTHRDLAIRCLEAGLHVLIEKPISTTTGEGEDIVAAAERTGRVAAVGYSTRFRANTQRMKRLLDAGAFGRVHRWAYRFGSRGGWDPVSAYHLDRTLSGGGVLVVIGSHFVDRMLHWFGWPSEVEYRDDSLGGPEANCTATLRFSRREGEIEGFLRLSKTFALAPPGFVMETDRGKVVLIESDSAPIVLRPKDAPETEIEYRERGHSADLRSSFQQQLEDFICACREDRDPRVPARQGLLSTRLMEELYASRQPLDLSTEPVGDAIRAS